jgi:putative tryptophan/tyrosine transport system substrate-binding protein
MMRRREFIAGLGAAVASQPDARAQQPDRMRRVGVLTGDVANDPLIETAIAAFRDGMTKLGWVERRNLRTELRFAGGDAERFRAYAAEVVRFNPDVIVVSFGAAMRAVQEQTRTIAIVMAGAGDIAANGTVKNLARPEGNITGFVNLFASIGSKWLELLKEAVPKVERVGYVASAETLRNTEDIYFSSIEEAARVYDVKAIKIQYRSAVDIVRAIDAFAAEPNGGLIVSPAVDQTPEILKAIHQLAEQHRLPTISSNRNFAAQGGMLAYGTDLTDLWRRASFYVDRILRGAKVSELPVEYPTKFRLVINVKAAKALGLAISESFLLRADELIE